MCIKIYSFLLMLIFAASHLSAQKIVVADKPFSQTGSEVSYQQNNISWGFQLFENGIVKVTCTPVGYTKNQQISNAVLLQPLVTNIQYNSTGNKLLQLGVKTMIAGSENGFDVSYNNAAILKQLSYFTDGNNNGFRLLLADDEQVFGGGERALPLNRRGYKFNLYNGPWYGYGVGADNLNYSLPFFISSKGYGIFFDNPSKGYVDIGKTNTAVFEAGFSSGELTLYIIPGKNISEIVQNFTGLTGRQPIPARWVFGNFVSRFGYRSEAQLMDVVSKMKADHFPVDAVILDLFWFGDSIKNTLGNLDWMNQQKWPNPKAMIGNLKQQNINTIIITEPFVLQPTANYDVAKKYLATDSSGNPFVMTDFYFGKGGLIDIFKKDAQDWFWSKYKKQIDIGIAGWWGDLGEPEKHPSGMLHDFSAMGIKQKLSADEVHNIYGHYWDKLLFDKYQSEYKDTRLFNLNRSGYAGSARYSVFPWTGDVGRNWSGFKAQLPILLTMSMSGVPFIHSDAGGFGGGGKDPELYTRWVQFACFTPVLRPHGTALGDYDTTVTDIPSEPVFWPDPYKSIVRNYMNMRYNLLPYNYSLAWEHKSSGKPLMRPMNFYNFSDSNLAKAEGQYMWGDAFLIAPVTEKGAVKKEIYFPAGNWYKYKTNAVHAGSMWDAVPVDMADMPIYVKAGSFVPSYTKTLENTGQYRSDTLRINYYPDTKSSSYTLYNDDGKTNQSFEKKLYELVYFKAAVDATSIHLTVSSNGGTYKGKPNRRLMIFSIPGLKATPTGLKVNGLKTPIQQRFDDEITRRVVPYAVWDPVNNLLNIRADFSNAALSIEFVK